jgi:hypothetical protein
MSNLSLIVLLLKEKIMFRSQKIKSDNRVRRKNKANTCRAPVFAPDYSTTCLAAKMLTNRAFYVYYISMDESCKIFYLGLKYFVVFLQL